MDKHYLSCSSFSHNQILHCIATSLTTPPPPPVIFPRHYLGTIAFLTRRQPRRVGVGVGGVGSPHLGTRP